VVKSRHCGFRRGLAALAMLASSGSLASADVLLSTNDLGAGAAREARAINNDGTVVGVANGRPFVLKPDGTTTEIGGGAITANGINDLGQVVGDAVNGGVTHAFLSSGDTLTTLGGQYSESHANDINNDGIAVGSVSPTAGGGQRPVLYDGNATIIVGTLGGQFGVATAINDARQIVGESDTANGNFHAFLFNNGVINDLGTLGGDNSHASGINEAGHVVGWAQVADGTPHAFFYNGGALQDLGVLPGFTASWATGINSSGQIVGFLGVVESGATAFEQHAFLYEDGVMTDLNTLVDPDSGWILTSALAINDNGEIIGYGTLNGEKQAYRLALSGGSDLTPEPVPEPTTFALLGVAAAAEGFRRYRRRGVAAQG
jgi:probable HAF family extracellular repeat protein